MKNLPFIVSVILFVVKDSSAACSEQGIFANPNDETCQTYIFCFRLSDAFLEKIYTCPNGTLFNPVTKDCKENYQCIPPTFPTTPTTAITTQTTPTSFECKAQGRFPEEADATCTKYYFCYYLPTGRYIKMNYTCPSGTKFDPRLQTCSSKVTCDISRTTVPTVSTVSTVPSVSTVSTVPTVSTVSTVPTSEAPRTFSCSKQGRFPVEEDYACRSYYYCLYLPNGSFTQQIYACPSGLKFNPKTQSCDQNYSCLSPSKTTTNSPTIPNNTFTCPSTGRFPDDTDPTCRAYFYCLLMPDGDLQFQSFKCPKNEKFDPEHQICRISYACPKEASSSSSYIYSTTFSILTTPPVDKTTETHDFVTSSLSPSNSLSPTSSNSPTDSLTPTNYLTPTTSLTPRSSSSPTSYSSDKPTTTEKVSEFSENLKELTVDETSIGNSSYTTAYIIKPICESVGRFPDLRAGDNNCQTYFLCVLGPDGDFMNFKYICDSNERFDPKLKKCSSSYTCQDKGAPTEISEKYEKN